MKTVCKEAIAKINQADNILLLAKSNINGDQIEFNKSIIKSIEFLIEAIKASEDKK